MRAGESEGDLIQQAVGGDRAALEELLVLHHDRLVASVEHLVPPDVRGSFSAEDACQEAYITVFQKVGQFEQHRENGFYRWVEAIAQRKLHDLAKAQRTLKRGGQGTNRNGDESRAVIGLLEMLAVHERTPSRSAAAKEAVGAVEAAMANLDDHYAHALRLRYVEALPVADVARRLDRTEGAVRMMCHRALRRLREELGSPWRFFSHK